jgi:TonB family protein
MNKSLSVLAAVILVTALFCNNKKTEHPKLVMQNDSLSVEKIRELDPVAAPDSVRFRNVGIRFLCRNSINRTVHDSIVTPFRERVSLLTGAEWSIEAAALLLNAALYREVLISGKQECSSFQKVIDSLQTRVEKMMIPADYYSFGTVVCEQESTLSEHVTTFLLLGVSSEIAELIDEFLHTDTTAATPVSGNSVKQMIKGLVSSPETAGEKKRLPVRKTTATEPKDNSAATLRYRDQKSIRDSITKHIPNLQQLYKKNLKKSSALRGNVVVTLRVAPGGRVISVRIKSTEISDKTFMKPFVAYLKTMRFKPIPAKAGAVTFDFPFEFNAEL